MPRRVGDDEFALFGGEEAVGDVDRDALLALGGEPVDQQREIDLLALCAVALAVAFERGELVLEDHPRIVEQPTDQRRLAIVHAAAGDEAQQALVLVLVKIGVDILGDEGIGQEGGGLVHQKYPSAFLSSMLADCPLSIARPCRSEPVASSISWMMSFISVALLTVAPVSG